MSKESKIRVHGFKDSSGQVKDFVNKHWNPRPLEPLNPHGFTLIEVILIMIIVGILAAVLMPKIDFSISKTVSADGAAFIIASDIRYAQECAMANMISKQVIFTQTLSTYTFSPTGNLDPSGQLPSGVTITSSNYTLTFNSLGEPISIPLTDLYVDVTVSGGGSPKTIRILNFTGKVLIL